MGINAVDSQDNKFDFEFRTASRSASQSILEQYQKINEDKCKEVLGDKNYDMFALLLVMKIKKETY